MNSSSFNDAYRRGLAAIRENLVPALVLQLALGALVASYFLWPSSAVVLYQLSEWKSQGGLCFSFVAGGFAGGILAEFCKVYFGQRGRWKLSNVEDGLFNFFLLGFGSSVVHLFYEQQAVWFGDRLALSVMLTKTGVDMLLFTPIWATPYQTIFWLWKTHRYSWPAVSRELHSGYIRRHYFPLLMMEWAFWIPVVMMLYSLPTLLQFPFYLVAMAIWGLLLAALSKSGVNHSEGPASSCRAETGINRS